MFYKGRKIRQTGEYQNVSISNSLLVAVLLPPGGYLRHLVCKDAQYTLLIQLALVSLKRSQPHSLWETLADQPGPHSQSHTTPGKRPQKFSFALKFSSGYLVQFVQAHEMLKRKMHSNP